MSVSMAVRLKNETRRSESLSNFEDVYAEQKSLDRAAKAAGAKSLFSFTHGLTEELGWAHRELGNPDVDVMSEAQREKFDAKLEKTRCRVGRWYAATDGLKAVDALLAHRKASGAAEGSIDHLLEDLRSDFIIRVGDPPPAGRHRWGRPPLNPPRRRACRASCSSRRRT